MIAVATYATKGYAYSLGAWARRTAAAVHHHDEGLLVFVTDKSQETAALWDRMRRAFPPAWKAEIVKLPITEYKHEDGPKWSMVVSRLQGAAFEVARAARVDALWSVESDILVPPEALRVSEDVLRFDDGYYSLAQCTYPNALFLGGHGSETAAIHEDFRWDERELPMDLKRQWAQSMAEEAEWNRKRERPPEEWIKSHTGLRKKVMDCPPRANIWQLIHEHGWRRRGWFDFAYPAIGRGAVVPVDWIGMGCTLLGRRALELATFEGYDGNGTQDLFLCHRRWLPAGLRIANIPHVVCDHVKRSREDGKITHLQAYHERAGEYAGHLRTRAVPWIDPENPSL